jgi:hypothetical protein
MVRQSSRVDWRWAWRTNPVLDSCRSSPRLCLQTQPLPPRRSESLNHVPPPVLGSREPGDVNARGLVSLSSAGEEPGHGHVLVAEALAAGMLARCECLSPALNLTLGLMCCSVQCDGQSTERSCSRLTSAPSTIQRRLAMRRVN